MKKLPMEIEEILNKLNPTDAERDYLFVWIGKNGELVDDVLTGKPPYSQEPTSANTK